MLDSSQLLFVNFLEDLLRCLVHGLSGVTKHCERDLGLFKVCQDTQLHCRFASVSTHHVCEVEIEPFALFGVGEPLIDLVVKGSSHKIITNVKAGLAQHWI